MLAALREYAARLSDLAPPGYVETPVRYRIDLAPDGRLLGVVDQGEGPSARDRAGTRMFTPTVIRTIGVKPKLLCDIGEYVLGIARDPANRARAARAHRAFLDLVRECADATRESVLSAVLAFLDAGAELGESRPTNYDPGANVTFCVDGVWPIELPSVRGFWATYSAGGGGAAAAAQCLVCGEWCQPSRVLAYKWKGIPQGQASGLALISANAPAFASYGHEQSLIAPTCAQCGERFSKAANDLLASGTSCLRFGAIACIFWTREAADFSPVALLADPQPERVAALLAAAQPGRAAGLDSTPFYAAALSASGSRVVVRHWLDTTLGEAQRHFARYFRLQAIVGPDGAEASPLKLVALAGATVRDLKDLTPWVAQALLGVALGAQAPPALLFGAVRRCRADGGVSRPQAALIKMALLGTRERAGGDTMADRDLSQLDPEDRRPAYLCGRLLAVLGAIRREALASPSASVIERQYGLASTAPATVFGGLLRGAQPHLGKLRRDRPVTYAALQERLEGALSGLAAFPQTLTLTEQGLFALGYYHQRAADRAADRARRGGASAAIPRPILER